MWWGVETLTIWMEHGAFELDDRSFVWVLLRKF